MPYTYLIGWSSQNKFYYGARWAKDCSPSDLWNTYFTSSKHVKAFRKENGEPDIIQVRKIFEDVNKCKIHERKVLQKLNVLSSNKWLNKNINGMFLPTGEQSKEHIAKRVRSGIETRKQNGTYGITAWTKETHPSTADKIQKAHKGKPKSAEHIANMRFRPQDNLILNCPHCDKTGDYKNMNRWHMDRCKHNPNRTSDKDPKIVVCFICGYTAKQSPNFYRNHNNHCRHQSQSEE